MNEKYLISLQSQNSTATQVAATGSVFCALPLLSIYKRIDGGSSNARKATAVEGLTHRNALFNLSKFNCMENRERYADQPARGRGPRLVGDIIREMYRSRLTGSKEGGKQ